MDEIKQKIALFIDAAIFPDVPNHVHLARHAVARIAPPLT
ncbi:hypothetical protein HNQ53_002191 [Microbulbifer hydrolyticus]|uniref:Uncharacterized protein n=1 Tax=Microbulbifer hydrolyticus TaxID=48074 RepID=A0AA89PBU5_9GAMM|nr:hypothetical protein [Microbulbifer hydrolyticus]